MDLKLLEEIGLSKAETTVYLALLELGAVPSGSIVQQTGQRKSTVYESIKRLSQKGLVSYIIKKGLKHFEAASPDRLIDFVEEKERKLKKEKEDAKKLVVDLKKGFDILKPQAEAQVLEGIEGFKTMRRDALRNAKAEHLIIGAISREDEVRTGFFEEWNKERQQKKINLKILHKQSAKGKPMTKESYMGKYFETRYLPQDVESPAVINIYGDRVVNVLWKGRNPLCFMLINKEIADSYRKYFEYLWKISRN